MQKNNTLTTKEVKKLVKLGTNIVMGLECNINSTGLPCRTDRLDAVGNMIEYLTIHGFNIKEQTNNVNKM